MRIARCEPWSNSRMSLCVSIGRSSGEFLHQHLRTPIPVVFAFARLGQPLGVGLLKTTLDEPVHRARGQYEDALQSHRLGTLLRALEQSLAVALALHVGRDRERCHLAG